MQSVDQAWPNDPWGGVPSQGHKSETGSCYADADTNVSPTLNADIE
jgi:hypothetical protein